MTRLRMEVEAGAAIHLPFAALSRLMAPSAGPELSGRLSPAAIDAQHLWWEALAAAGQPVRPAQRT
jgi:hypothetical protein